MPIKSPADRQPKPCPHCGTFGGTLTNHHPDCCTLVGAPVAHAGIRFAAVREVVMQGTEFVAKARGHTMALRIANALNRYRPNARGF
jgi:hypothetical protein